jgi:hypothetical protein
MKQTLRQNAGALVDTQRRYQATLVRPGRDDGRHDAWMSALGDTQRKTQPAITTRPIVSASDHGPKPHTEPRVAGPAR